LVDMRKFWRLLIDFTGDGKTTTQELIHRLSVGSRLAGLERGDGMSAYVVLMQQIDDIDRYVNGYVPATQPLLRKHGAKMLVGGGRLEAEPAQGDPPNSTVDPLRRRRGSVGLSERPRLSAREGDSPRHHVAGTGCGHARVHAGK